MTAILAGLRYELAVARRSPGEFAWLFVSPLYAVIFLIIVEHSGRSDLIAYAVLGPAIMSLVGTAVVSAGNLIDRDRWDGILELELITPSSFSMVIAGRVLAVMCVALVTMLETWLVAGLFFGHWVTVAHPVVFGLVLMLTVAATDGTATLMAALFVLARSARIFQNSVTFPFYILGGAVVPVDNLPAVVRPLSRLVYLSWATDLLRESTAPPPVDSVAGRCAILVALGAVSTLAGMYAVRAVSRRVRTSGSVSYS